MHRRTLPSWRMRDVLLVILSQGIRVKSEKYIGSRWHSTLNEDRLDKALEFTTSMMSTRDLDQLIDNIMDIITGDFGFEGCDALLLDKEKNEFVMRASKGFAEVGFKLVGRLTKSVESVMHDLDDCESLGRFTCIYRAKEGDDPSGYFSLLHPERAKLPRENPDDWHELDVLYVKFEDEKGRIVGFLQPDGPKDGRIPSGQLITNLEIFAALASIAVANAEIVSELNRNVMIYKTMAKTTAAIQDPVDLKETIRRIADSLNTLVPFDEISVYLIDWEKNLLMPVYATGPYANEAMADIGPISGLAGVVARSGKVEIVKDSMDDERVEDIPGIDEEEIRQTMMCIPLKSKAGEVEGVLDLYRDKSRQFTVAEWEIAEPFATHAAIALENARLREELKSNFESVQRAFEDMKTLDKAKDSLVNTISHELRTPLTTILGYLEMASHGMYGEISPKLKEKMNTMVSSVNRINSLVGKMLEMSRLQDGTLILDKEPVNLALLVKEVVRDLDEETNTKKHTLTVLFGGELPVVNADRLRLRDVLFNLINNAIRYTAEGGQITIGADILSGKVHIWIKDTGKGIADSDKQKIFDRFFLADMGLTRDDGRVGIGLYVSREIIRKHGGDMWFESSEAVGSTFHFTIPLMRR
ncbi:MAG: GAF domain-containing sensor histidine kinase [Candidatus Thermoplasmatota archaeon]|nr:GAF domain-containing sensor histidine kinase [Candidatus Thermoplasmatota archaeon]